MFAKLQTFIDQWIKAPGQGAENSISLELAAAVLAVEVIRADYEIDQAELDAVIAELQQSFDLDKHAAKDLLNLARERAEAATCLYEFTRLLNAQLQPEDKEQIMVLLWKVALADGSIHHYEEHLIRKVADLLYLHNAQFIKTREKAIRQKKSQAN